MPAPSLLGREDRPPIHELHVDRAVRCGRGLQLRLRRPPAFRELLFLPTAGHDEPRSGTAAPRRDAGIASATVGAPIQFTRVAKNWAARIAWRCESISPGMRSGPGGRSHGSPISAIRGMSAVVPTAHDPLASRSHGRLTLRTRLRPKGGGVGARRRARCPGGPASALGSEPHENQGKLTSLYSSTPAGRRPPAHPLRHARQHRCRRREATSAAMFRDGRAPHHEVGGRGLRLRRPHARGRTAGRRSVSPKSRSRPGASRAPNLAETRLCTAAPHVLAKRVVGARGGSPLALAPPARPLGPKTDSHINLVKPERRRRAVQRRRHDSAPYPVRVSSADRRGTSRLLSSCASTTARAGGLPARHLVARRCRCPAHASARSSRRRPPRA